MLKNIHYSWKYFLEEQVKQEYFQELINKVKTAYQQSICYPKSENILKLLKIVNFNEIKVVILGQDPYHQPLQANGLAFSVDKDTVLPASLKNIFLELKNDLQINNLSGDLTKWAKQGVFLLNTVLSVQKNQPFSHSNFNWQEFTDNLIKYINDHLNNIVFVLWGKKAQLKTYLIDTSRHLILKGSHPSPLGAHYGFFNQNYFSKINEYLKQHKKELIDWQL